MNKKIKYIIIAIILMFFSCNHVYADCSDIGDLVTDYNTYKSKLNEYLQTNSTTCDDTANNETVITCNDSKIHMNYIVSKLMKEYNEGNVCSSKKTQVEEIMKENKDNCYQVFDDDFNNFVNKVMLIFYIVGPILLILFGSLDYAKAVVASSEDELKKANKRFIKRLTATILLFLSPVIVNFILSFNLSDYYTSGNIYACDFSYKVYNKKFKINTVLTKSKNNKTASTSYSTLLQAADAYHKQIEREKYTYTVNLLYWNDIEKSTNNPNKSTVCATFAASAIYKAGLFTAEELNSCNYNSSTALYNFLKSKGWREIRSYDEMLPGDVGFLSYGTGEPDHTQIYAGDNMWYTAGCTEHIQGASPLYSNDRGTFFAAMRPY